MAPGSRRRGSKLITLGSQIAAFRGRDRLHNQVLGLDGPGSGRGETKKLIFAADGAKSKIVLRDGINNDPEIGENAAHRLSASGPGPYWPARENRIDRPHRDKSGKYDTGRAQA
jgi:hypothetical protein